jgi:hypothetical protein
MNLDAIKLKISNPRKKEALPKIKSFKTKILALWRRKPVKIGIGVVIVLVIVGVVGALNGWWGGGGRIPADTFTRGLVGYWTFDEGTGTTTYDASGQGHHGTILTVEVCYDGLDNDGDDDIDCLDSDCDDAAYNTGSGNYIYCRDNHMWSETLAVAKSWGHYGETVGSCPSHPDDPTFPACYACYSLNYAGFSDWILPTQSQQGAAWGGSGDAFTCSAAACEAWDTYCCNASGGTSPSCYWSSTEQGDNYGGGYNFSAGNYVGSSKDYNYFVRCVRQ